MVQWAQATLATLSCCSCQDKNSKPFNHKFNLSIKSPTLYKQVIPALEYTPAQSTAKLDSDNEAKK